MQYRIFKRDNTVEVKGLVRNIPDHLKKAGFLLPFSQKEDSVTFLLHGEQTLTAFLQYSTEIRFLTSLYSICKCMEAVTECSDALLQFVLDSQYIFFDENESIRGILAPQDSAEQVDYKGFFWNLFFMASFQSKDVPVVREMLSFIRAARAITPRDLILFIEMSSLGKDIIESYNSHIPASGEPSRQESGKKDEPNPNELQTGNDFSDFLKSFEQPYLYEEEAEDATQYAPINYTPTSTSVSAFSDQSEQDDLLSAASDAPIESPAVHSASVLQNDALDEPLVETPVSPRGDVLDEQFIREPSGMQDDILDEPFIEKPAVPVVSNEPFVPESHRPQAVEPETPHRQAVASTPANEHPNHINNIMPSLQNNVASQQAVRPVFVQPVAQSSPAEAGYPVYVPSGTRGADSVSSGQQMHYFLVTTDGRSIPLLKERIHIGRSVQNVDLPVQDMFVSRVHSVITRNASGIYYTDLNPRNSSFINGISISPNTPHALKDEDKIQIGKTVFYLRCVRAVR